MDDRDRRSLLKMLVAVTVGLAASASAAQAALEAAYPRKLWIRFPDHVATAPYAQNVGRMWQDICHGIYPNLSEAEQIDNFTQGWDERAECLFCREYELPA